MTIAPLTPQGLSQVFNGVTSLRASKRPSLSMDERATRVSTREQTTGAVQQTITRLKEWEHGADLAGVESPEERKQALLRAGVNWSDDKIKRVHSIGNILADIEPELTDKEIELVVTKHSPNSVRCLFHNKPRELQVSLFKQLAEGASLNSLKEVQSPEAEVKELEQQLQELEAEKVAAEEARETAKAAAGAAGIPAKSTQAYKEQTDKVTNANRDIKKVTAKLTKAKAKVAETDDAVRQDLLDQISAVTAEIAEVQTKIDEAVARRDANRLARSEESFRLKQELKALKDKIKARKLDYSEEENTIRRTPTTAKILRSQLLCHLVNLYHYRDFKEHYTPEDIAVIDDLNMELFNIYKGMYGDNTNG